MRADQHFVCTCAEHVCSFHSSTGYETCVPHLSRGLSRGAHVSASPARKRISTRSASRARKPCPRSSLSPTQLVPGRRARHGEDVSAFELTPRNIEESGRQDRVVAGFALNRLLPRPPPRPTGALADSTTPRLGSAASRRPAAWPAARASATGFARNTRCDQRVPGTRHTLYEDMRDMKT